MFVLSPFLPLIIDCDPGHDDAVALLLAFAWPERLQVRAITTVAGNTAAAQTASNAQQICALAGRDDVAVYEGCTTPMVRPFMDASDFQGPSGMDGFKRQLRVPMRTNVHAVDFLIAHLTAAPEPVTLVCLGPLTNLATALSKAPAIRRGIARVVFMGGARRSGGNVTPCATFNVHCDPHAAQEVLQAGLPVVVVSLDATSQVKITDTELDQWEALGGEVPTAAAEMMRYFNRRRVQRHGYTPGDTTLNDPCVLAYLLSPDLFTGIDVNIEVEISSDLTMGMTVVDYAGVTGRKKNAHWIDQVDGAAVMALVFDSMRNLVSEDAPGCVRQVRNDLP